MSSEENIYLLNIYDRNFTIETKYGRILRTPIKFHINESDKNYWDMQLKFKGIRNFIYTKLTPTPVETKQVEPKITVSKELIRPSSQIKKDN